MADERIEWTDTPSQVENLGWFIACLLIIPIPWAIWRWPGDGSGRASWRSGRAIGEP